MSGSPLVSVAMITYNHRQFIGQAIESVLAQRRDFPIEIVISDDCSPDGAATVIDEYQARHPEMFRRLDPPHNIGMNRNFDRVWRACTGKYIAMLEGDDWWYPDKLATQVAFMEQHPECTISGHTATVTNAAGEFRENRPVGWPEVSDITLLIKGCTPPTASILCRRGVVSEIPPWVMDLGMGDWPVCLLHAAKGRIGFINEPLSYYRFHAGGVWSPTDPRRQLEKMLAAAKTMREKFPPSFAVLFEGSLGHIHFQLFKANREAGDLCSARRHLYKSYVHRFHGREFGLDWLYKVPLRMLFPTRW